MNKCTYLPLISHNGSARNILNGRFLRRYRSLPCSSIRHRGNFDPEYFSLMCIRVGHYDVNGRATSVEVFRWRWTFQIYIHPLCAGMIAVYCGMIDNERPKSLEELTNDFDGGRKTVSISCTFCSPTETLVWINISLSRQSRNARSF